MDIIVALLVASAFAIPYRHLKMRYRLNSYDNSDKCFYGNDEMAKAYEKQINKQKQ